MYVTVPPALMTTVPCAGVEVDVTVSVPVPAVSFVSTETVTGVFTGVVAESSTATGATAVSTSPRSSRRSRSW